jgi:hypothetical protein
VNSCAFWGFTAIQVCTANQPRQLKASAAYISITALVNVAGFTAIPAGSREAVRQSGCMLEQDAKINRARKIVVNTLIFFIYCLSY